MPVFVFFPVIKKIRFFMIRAAEGMPKYLCQVKSFLSNVYRALPYSIKASLGISKRRRTILEIAKKLY